MPNKVDFADNTESLHNIGAYIMEYQPLQNAFLSAMVNRIGRVLVTSRLWENPWASFKKGKLEYGETVEEVFANIAKPHSYDPSVAEQQVFKREIPDVRAAFHTMNFQKFYKVTITTDQLRQAFLSYGELLDLVAKIVETLYTSMNLDEYLVMKYMMCREALNGGIYTVVVDEITGANANPEDAVTKFRQYTNDLTFLKTKFNRAHVRNSTPVERQTIIVPNDAEAVIGVKVLANAFNISEVQYLGRRIAIDSFEFDADDNARLGELFANDSKYQEFTGAEIAALQKIVALKTDTEWWMVFDNLQQFTENYNGQGLYWQYFYHTWKTFSVSPFANAVLFTTQESEITDVAVSPESANVAQGSQLQLTATVNGTGLIDKTVTWTLKGATDAETLIDGGTGLLKVAKNEPVGTSLTVTAASVDGQTGTSTITVTSA